MCAAASRCATAKGRGMRFVRRGAGNGITGSGGRLKRRILPGWRQLSVKSFLSRCVGLEAWITSGAAGPRPAKRGSGYCYGPGIRNGYGGNCATNLKCMRESRAESRGSKEFQPVEGAGDKKRAARQAALKLSQGSATFHLVKRSFPTQPPSASQAI